MSGSLLLYGTTYGQLNGNAVLVDRRGRIWLFDFGQVDQGPLVRDFVSLETTIKFELLANFDSYVRYEVEKRLLSVVRLDAEIAADGLEAEAQKALLAINHIRQHAVTVMGQELEVYFAGLLFYAVAQLATFNAKVRYPRNELAVYLHSLISAAMLCKNLMPTARENLPPEAFHTLWIDETNKEVWVEGRKVELAPGEYDLLILLYHQANQLCTRQEISQKLHQTDYGPVTEDAINTTVTRLRKKIEPDSRRPNYIITVRGEGYRLEIDHTPLPG
jgi:hypothetical protein